MRGGACCRYDIFLFLIQFFWGGGGEFSFLNVISKTRPKQHCSAVYSERKYLNTNLCTFSFVNAIDQLNFKIIQ